MLKKNVNWCFKCFDQLESIICRRNFLQTISPTDLPRFGASNPFFVIPLCINQTSFFWGDISKTFSWYIFFTDTKNLKFCEALLQNYLTKWFSQATFIRTSTEFLATGNEVVKWFSLNSCRRSRNLWKTTGTVAAYLRGLRVDNQTEKNIPGFSREIINWMSNHQLTLILFAF